MEGRGRDSTARFVDAQRCLVFTCDQDPPRSGRRGIRDPGQAGLDPEQQVVRIGKQARLSRRRLPTELQGELQLVGMDEDAPLAADSQVALKELVILAEDAPVLGQFRVDRVLPSSHL